MFHELSFLTSALITVSAMRAGPWVLRMLNAAFGQEVDEIPPYPIILKPYHSLIALYVLVGFISVLPLVAVNSSRDRLEVFMILGLPMALISVFSFGAAFLYSREAIVLEAEKITYKKGGKKIILHFMDFTGFSVTTGYVKIDTRRGGKPVVISLYFRDIKYLNAVLKAWTKNFGRPQHFSYPATS